MKTLSLVCGSRQTVFDFYKRVQKFSVQFLSGNTSPVNADSLDLEKNVKLINLKLKPKYIYDPIKLFYPKVNNLSWQYFDNLESNIESSHIIGLSDTYYFWNEQAVKSAKSKNIPVFLEVWCTIPNHITSRIKPYSTITKNVVDYASLIILRNKTAYGFAKSLGIPDSKLAVSYMGINLEHFKPAPKVNNHISILFVGTLVKEKGLLILLQSFEKLAKKYSNISLHVAGDGPLKQTVVESTKTLPVVYHGFVPYNSLPDLYQQADIFCAPSYTQKIFNIPIWQEYFSYTLMEAQASGLPIVSTISGGIPEEVDNNLLIPENNQVALFQAIETLISNESLRKELGQYNRQRAEKLFDLNKQVPQTEELISRIL
jgi:glycosyltransferase involved in cell wall biosynthesis